VETDVKLLVINNLKENTQLEYFFSLFYVILFCTVLSEIYLRRNILVTDRKELCMTDI